MFQFWLPYFIANNAVEYVVKFEILVILDAVLMSKDNELAARDRKIKEQDASINSLNDAINTHRKDIQVCCQLSHYYKSSKTGSKWFEMVNWVYSAL